jgi:PAS domain S-box-containing protein
MNDQHKTKQELLDEMADLRSCLEALAESESTLRQANETLLLGESYYRSLVDISHSIVYRLSEDGRIIIISPAIKQLGYDPGELVRKPFEDIVHPDDRQKSRDHFVERRIGDRRMKNLEIRLLTKHQDPHDFEINYRTVTLSARGQWNVQDGDITSPDKRFLCTQGIARDITQRKRADAELRQAADNFRNFVEDSMLGVRIVSAAGDTLYANKAILDIYGYESIDELKATPAENRYTLTSLAEHKARREKRKKGDEGPPEYEISILRKDGSVRHLQVFRKAIRWNGEMHYQVLYHDITDSRRAEDTLRSIEELNIKLLAAIPDFVVLTDVEGNIQFINDAGLKTSGYKREEVIGLNVFTFIDAQDHKKALHNFKLMFSSTLGPEVYQLVMKDSKKLFYEVNGDVLRNEDGSAFGLVFVCRNITERKQAEEERHRLEAQLLQAHKMEAIGTLAGGIAHDFNNLLMGIQGYTSLMLMSIGESSPLYEKLRSIENQVRSGAELTRQLLGFARGGRYEVRPTDLNELVGKTAAMFGRTKKEVRIHEKYAAEIWPVEVDRGQMEQVLLNLFVNAWQAMPAGGDLYLQTQNVRLDESYVAPYKIKTGPYVKISVTDTGVGMDERTRLRIFDPFFTTKEMGRGTGLGLASAYGIIKGHSGFVNVYSERGHGSTFNIYLPVTDKQVIREESLTPDIQTGHETILMVDDEKTVLDVTREMLEVLGYRVLTAHSGQEAIEAYQTNRYDIDLMILDMIMPGMGGGEVYDRLKKINPEVRVILSSGYSLNGMAKSILDKGVQSFLQKPFRLDELSQKIRDTLDR